MHVIVTHSNADFDAIASMLAARILYPDAVPVLPPMLNRNVRDFVINIVFLDGRDSVTTTGQAKTISIGNCH